MKRFALPPDAIARARELRRNAGPPERTLWAALRTALPLAGFRQQVPFGPYHADFASHAAKLIVEVDDATHALKAEQDGRRTRFLEGEGYRVLRFWNNDMMTNIEGVVATIADALPEALKGHRR